MRLVKHRTVTNDVEVPGVRFVVEGTPLKHATVSRHNCRFALDYLKTAGGASIGLMFGPKLLAQYATKPVSAVAGDEAFWAAVRSQFRLTNDYINLENGYYCFQPEPVLRAFIDNVRAVSLEASHYMRSRQVDDKLRIRGKLAAFRTGTWLPKDSSDPPSDLQLGADRRH